MISKLVFALVCTLGLLAGCASRGAAPEPSAQSGSPLVSSGSGGLCNSDTAQSAVGQKVSPGLVESSRRQAGARTARALRPDEVITTEYDPQRLNLKVDDQGVVKSASCG